MSAVVISRSLRLDIGDNSAKELGRDFLDYKLGRDSFGDVFGRDKAHTKPAEIKALNLWHVHLWERSVDDAWDRLWAQGYPQDNFTSDKILVYGHMPDVVLKPWLLLTMLSPFGHEKMEDELGMRAIAEEYKLAKQAYINNPSPAHWIIIK